MNVNYLHYYKHRHLSCGKAQFLYELLNKGVPVDYLFYDSYVETEDIWNQIMIEGFNRWTMSALILSDLSDIGIDIEREHFPDLYSAYPYMQRFFKENKTLYIFAAQKHLPHLDFQGVHAIGLENYNSARKSFTIFDIPVLVSYEYDENYIQNAYNDLPIDYKFIYNLCDSNYNFSEEAVKKLIGKFENSFLEVDDELFLYDRIVEMMQDHSCDFKEHKNLYTRLENVFAAIAGSRYLLSKFLKVTGYSNVEKLLLASNNSNIIQNIFMKGNMGGNITKYNVENRILELKAVEKEIINSLKKVILQKKNQFVNLFNQNQKATYRTPIDLRLTYESTVANRIKLMWENVWIEEYIYGYEIYVNDKLHGTTLQNTYEIVELPFNTVHNITIKTKTFNGYMNQINDNVIINIPPKFIDYAKLKPVYCSSEESSVFKKENINNGLSATRWSSQAERNEDWICIDLLEETKIKRIILNWEYAYAKSYKIAVSNDRIIWETIVSTENGEGGVEEYYIPNDVIQRYIKIDLLKKGTPWGYSLWSFEVYAE